MRAAGAEEVFLPQMAKIRANFLRQRQMVIDDQPNPSGARNRDDGLSHAANFFQRGLFGAKLDQVRAAVAELLCDKLRRQAMQIRRVHKPIKRAVRKSLHRVFANIVCQSHSELSAKEPARVCKTGANIIHCNHLAQRKRRPKAASHA